ncbi:MAG TPA: acylphosphatase [Thermomicrobiales bacterium]|nr:acylphosphatase [Thermomicrobiales bacterium]
MSERRMIRVTGRVQGVFFRATAKEWAEALGLAGFAKNEPDGSVLLVVEGDPASLDRFVAWCQVGPPDAEVEGVEITVERPEGLSGFTVQR